MDLSKDFALEMEELWLINKLTSKGNSKYVATEFARLEDAGAILSYLDLFMSRSKYTISLGYPHDINHVDTIIVNYKDGENTESIYLTLRQIRIQVKELRSLNKDMGTVSRLHKFFHFIYNPRNQ